MYTSSFGSNSFQKFGGVTGNNCEKSSRNGYGKSFDSSRQGNFEPGSRLQPTDWECLNIQPVHREPYIEHIAIKNRSQDEIDTWFINNEVILDGQNIPRPIFEFDESTFLGNFKFFLSMFF